MAEPKKRTNKSKRGMRQMHQRIVVPGFGYCQSCHESKLPHRVCKSCGKYNGKEVFKTDIEIKKEVPLEKE